MSLAVSSPYVNSSTKESVGVVLLRQVAFIHCQHSVGARLDDAVGVCANTLRVVLCCGARNSPVSIAQVTLHISSTRPENRTTTIIVDGRVLTEVWPLIETMMYHEVHVLGSSGVGNAMCVRACVRACVCCD